jgi:hypothetical protein
VQEAITDVGIGGAADHAGGSLAPAAAAVRNGETASLVAQAASVAAEAAREASAAASAALAVDSIGSLPVTASTVSWAVTAAQQVVSAAEALERASPPMLRRPDASAALDSAHAINAAVCVLSNVEAAGRALTSSFSCDASGSGGASTSIAHVLDAARVLRAAVEPSDLLDSSLRACTPTMAKQQPQDQGDVWIEEPRAEELLADVQAKVEAARAEREAARAEADIARVVAEAARANAVHASAQTDVKGSDRTMWISYTLDATQAAAQVLRTALEPSDIANVVANERNSSSFDAHEQAVSEPAHVELLRIRVEALVLTNALAEADALVAQRRCPIVDALLNAIGGDEHDRAAAMRLLGRVSPSELAPHAAALVLHVGAVDTNVSCAALHVLSRLLPSALTESDHVALLRVLRRASATVQRVAVLAPAPLPVECLRLLRPAPPLCEPPLLVVHADRAIDGELDDLADGALVVALVVAIGPDALRLALLDKLPLRARRALACASVAFRGVVTPHLRASMLAVADEDADWDNAAFVARLPDLTMLCMGVGAPHDLQALRAQPQLNLAQLSVESALFLGAVLGGSVESVRLSLPDGFGAPQVVHAAPMRHGLRLAFGTPRMGAADVAFFRALFARNPHFKPDDVEAALRSMVEARGRRRSYVTAADRALLQAGVDAVLPTVNVALAP